MIQRECCENRTFTFEFVFLLRLRSMLGDTVQNLDKSGYTM